MLFVNVNCNIHCSWSHPLETDEANNTAQRAPAWKASFTKDA